MHNIFIEGKKIDLKAVSENDLELFCRCINSPDIRETFFTAFPTNDILEKEKLKDIYKNTHFIPFVIMEKESKRKIGITAFHRVDHVSRAAVYSIIIHERNDWGKGYGSEVTKLMVDYAFNILNLNRIQLHVCAENTAGIKAYIKAGFVQEGVLREAMYHNNEYCDFLVMGLLRKEYYE